MKAVGYLFLLGSSYTLPFGSKYHFSKISTPRMLSIATSDHTSDESVISRTSRINIERRLESMKEKCRCVDCFMSKALCICPAIKSLWAPLDPPTTRIAIFYHYKEWGRSSNTGKLLSIGLGPEHVETFIFGNSQHEAALNKLLTSNPSAVLFAGKKSMPITTLLAQRAELSSPLSESDSDRRQRPVLCVIDSTWGQAPAMEKVIDYRVPRVHVDLHVEKPSDFLSRKQSSTQTKISTIEAVALALTQSGERTECAEAIHHSLLHSVDSLKVQGGRKVAFDHVIIPNARPEYGHGPYTAPIVNKPAVCPLCGGKPPGGFRNQGVRRPFDESTGSHQGGAHRVWRCSGCSEFFNVSIDSCGDDASPIPE